MSILESATTDPLEPEAAGMLAAPAYRRVGALRRLLRTPRGIVGVALVGLVMFTAIFASTLAPGDPFDTSAGPRLLSPRADHPFGTDTLGRDIFTGVVHGTRTSMTVVFWVVLISTVVGVAIGALSGFRGGWVDDLTMRVAELFQTVPRFFLALLVISFWGRGIDKLIILLGLTSWPFLARVVRAETIQLKRREFVEAAAALGSSSTRVLARHVIPNLLPPVIVVVALFASRVIMIEAGLAFLGLGDPSRISWGSMANYAQQFLQLGWWMPVFPGLAILVAVLGLNLLGDALNDALDPRASAGGSGRRR